MDIERCNLLIRRTCGPVQTSAQNQVTVFDPPSSKFTTFDPPGSTLTVPASINQAGEITGYYTDASNVGHGFLRSASGAFTTFDPPGSMFTIPESINATGTIAGFYYLNPKSRPHGFLRASDGTFIYI